MRVRAHTAAVDWRETGRAVNVLGIEAATGLPWEHEADRRGEQDADRAMLAAEIAGHVDPLRRRTGRMVL